MHFVIADSLPESETLLKMSAEMLNEEINPFVEADPGGLKKSKKCLDIFAILVIKLTFLSQCPMRRSLLGNDVWKYTY